MPNHPDTIVITHGVFDLLHSNHIEALRVAKSFGGRLIVVVHSDAVAAAYKRLPVLPEDERLKQVQSIRHVDAAFIDRRRETPEMQEDTFQQFHADHYVYFGQGLEAELDPWARRGLLRRLPYHDGISTSVIIESVRLRYGEGAA
ncbi:MAG: adenylyltransferase/cytidyltransferase family protein [Rhodobacteraceae bacterium]|nr:adenylyltransferase/cytidyltransferase family protein [Paracoccaceae bacterium]